MPQPIPPDPDPAPPGAADLQAALGHQRTLERDAVAGRMVQEFAVRPAFCHSGGIAQGGFVTGWIDSTMAGAAIARSGGTLSPVTLEIKVVFYRPARAGTVVRAEAWVDRWGKATAFLEGCLLDADGRMLAKATSTVRLLPLRSA